jgi:hypothetical protein
VEKWQEKSYRRKPRDQTDEEGHRDFSTPGRGV